MSLVREFKIKWWIGFNQEFCDQMNVLRFLETGEKLKWMNPNQQTKLKWMNPNQQTIKGVSTPTAPQKKENQAAQSREQLQMIS